jgi:SAM-dependent methyltransferase
MAKDPDPIELVRRGYDAIAERYRRWTEGSEVREWWLRKLEDELPPAARVLELGCGAGTPVALRLSRAGFDVLGIDSSQKQIELARRHAPAAAFQVGDMAAVDFSDARFEAVLAFYSITHVPRERHEALFERIWRWLVPGGIFVASLGTRDCPAWTGEWLGTEMFFSHFDTAENLVLLQRAGFELRQHDVIGEDEGGEVADFLWVVAERPRGPKEVG